MEQQAPASTFPSDPKAIVSGLTDSSLQFDAPTAVSLLLQVQSGYDSKAIGEQDYVFAQGELLKKISPSETPSTVQAPQGSSERVQVLYRQKAEIVRILDGLADAVASGKLSDADYEKLHVSNNARLSQLQARIDAESSGQPRVVSIQRKEIIPSAIILASSASKASELPARAKEIKQELSEAQAAPSSEPAVDQAWVSRYEKSMSELETSEKRMRNEASQFKGTLDSLYSKLSNLESQVANLQTETGYIGTDVSKIKVTEQDQPSKDVEARMTSLSNEFEGRVLELSTRLSNAETQMSERLAEIRGLVDKVDQFRQAMGVAAESARQVQEIQRQVDRAERVAGLLGKTFVNSQKKFEELDEISIRQAENEAKLASVSARLAALESTLDKPPISSAKAQPQTQPAADQGQNTTAG
ncbi:MAG: hypothetical protein WCX64_04885 [Candidatus Micrarchaeia archaeon]